MLSKQDAVVHLSVELRKRLGFRQEGGSSRNGSRYLVRPGLPFKLRISDHLMPKDKKAANPEVVSSWVMGEMEPAEIPALARRIADHFEKRVAQRKGLTPA